MSKKQLLTGNEAVAQGAYEAGINFASAYPGTPSTEILENLSQLRDETDDNHVYCEWAPNEKVALEAAIGASVGGVRSMVTMKHVGVNVAADPLFTNAYTGVTGGLVLVSADDPGMHSSQNEQDNRNYATAARLLMLEPSDSQESLDFAKKAFELSEHFDTPVLLRMTTRVCHSKSIVNTGERINLPKTTYKKNIQKFVATPANAKVLREQLKDRIKAMYEYACTEAFAQGISKVIEPTSQSGKKIGVISAGVAYQYAKDAFGDSASYLKLGMTFPLPIDAIQDFAKTVDVLYVVEELDPYMESQIKAAGIDVIGKSVIPESGELNADIVRQAVFGESAENLKSAIEAVGRPPAMCAGCPHRGLFYQLAKLQKKQPIMIAGDIGCYTLGSAPPLSALDTCFCMGGSISSAHGAYMAHKSTGREEDITVFSVIGDSTFLHTGINSLMNSVYNKSRTINIILDNRITAMTGQQQNPGTGYTLMGEETTQVDIPLLCKSIGVAENQIHIINPLDLNESEQAIQAAMAEDGVSVIITRYPCVLKRYSAQDKTEFGVEQKVCKVDNDKCKLCKICVGTGCPAIVYSGDRVDINAGSCNGCTLCQQVCPFDAII